MADLLTTRQVQDLLKVDRTTIYRMVENGLLPGIRVGKQWRFSRADIERWLQTNAAPPAAAAVPAPAQPVHVATRALELREVLPLACAQLIQDAFADLIGVMMVITDMQGHPVTQISNPCGFYTALTQNPEAVAQCISTWRELATNPTIQPAFLPNEMGLLCARGLIHVEHNMKGMLVIGGIAPDSWPPNADRLADLAQTFGLPAYDVALNAGAVYRLDKAARERALRSVQRIADIFSHIAGDRNAINGRLQEIASLASVAV